MQKEANAFNRSWLIVSLAVPVIAAFTSLAFFFKKKDVLSRSLSVESLPLNLFRVNPMPSMDVTAETLNLFPVLSHSRNLLLDT